MFKVGDVVVATESANKAYLITKEGYKVVVVRVYSRFMFKGRSLKDSRSEFNLYFEHFKLANITTEKGNILIGF